MSRAVLPVFIYYNVLSQLYVGIAATPPKQYNEKLCFPLKN